MMADLFSGNRLKVIFGFLLIKSLFFAYLLPPWMGNDEPNHFDLVLITAGVGSGESNQKRIIESLNRNNFWERTEMVKTPLKSGAEKFSDTPLWYHSESMTGSRPPLYYFLAGLPVRLLGSEYLERTLLLSRTVSVALTMLTFLFIYLSAREVFQEPGSEHLPVFTVLLAGLHPQFSYLSVVVNADVLGMLVFSAFFYFTVLFIRLGRAGVWEGLVLIVLCGVGLFTKKQGLLLLPMSFVALAMACKAEGRYAREVLKRWAMLATAMVVGLLLLEFLTPLVVVKLADRVAISVAEFFSSPDDLAKLGAGQLVRAVGVMFVTFWFTYGQMVHKLSYGFYLLLGGVTGLTAWMSGSVLWRTIREKGYGAAESRALLFSLFFVLFILGAIVFTFFSPRWIERVSSRYLFYAVAPLAVLATVGLREMFVRFSRIPVGEAFVALLFALNFVSAWFYLAPIYYGG